jgi:hypothetical protein
MHIRVIACTRRKALLVLEPCLFTSKAGEREMHLYPTREKHTTKRTSGREQKQKAPNT